MNNKGFTLVELLAVLVILLTISLVAVGGISASLERRDVKECEEQRELAISAAKIYFSLNDVSSVSIGTLNGLEGREDYFKNDYKIDKLKDGDFIKFNNGKYVYVATDGSCVVNDNIDEDIDEDIDDDMQDVVEVITITYDANGGSGAPESQTKYKDTTLTLSTTKPTRNGYTFLGWSTDPSATTATYSAGGSYTANVGAMLYAVWEVGVLYLYNYGTEYTDITGSLVSALRAIDSEQDVTRKPSIIKNADSIKIDHRLGLTQYSAVSGIAYWNKKIDLTNYSTLTFKGTLSGTSTWRGVAVWSTLSGHVGIGRVKQITSLTNGTGTVNISDLKGEYYIGFWVYESAPYVTMNYLALS